MRILLDTSVIVRIGLSSREISPALKDSIVAASELLVSPIARSEIAIKFSTGKLPLPLPEDRFWDRIVEELQASELSYDCRHAGKLATLPMLHRDPFDRMLTAQCLVEDVAIATTDSIFADYGVRVV